MSDLVEKYCEWVNTKSYEQLTVSDFIDAFSIDRMMLAEQVDEFFDHEHLITKTECFWWVASFVYSYRGVWTSRWEEAFCRYDRLDSHLNKRLLWTNSTTPDTHEYQGAQSGFLYQPPKSDRDAFADFFQKRNMETPFTVYRGFRVRKGEAVRDGVKKLDNPNAHLQVEGAAASFSLNPVVAVSHLNHHHNQYFIRQNTGLVDDEEVRQFVLKCLGFSGDEPEHYHYQIDGLMLDAYACLGTYEVKKKDIIMVRTADEEEIVFPPDKAKLVRYDFLSWTRAYAAIWAKSFLLIVHNKDDVRLRSIRFDMNKLLDIFEKVAVAMRPHISQVLGDKEPKNLRMAIFGLMDVIYNNINQNKEVSDEGYDWTLMTNAISDAFTDVEEEMPTELAQNKTFGSIISNMFPK
jgi:hypothetical protein